MLSIIIPAHNSLHHLEQSLPALLTRMPPSKDEVEILVIDDASTDGTWDWLQKQPVRSRHLENRAGPAAARNHGAKKAHGDVLLFLDADVVVQHDTIGRVLVAFSEDPVPAAVQGVYTLCRADKNLPTTYQNDYYHYSFMRVPHEETAISSTYCFAILRDLFERMGGFHTSIREPTVEDEEFGYRLVGAGYAVRLDKDLLVEHLAEYDMKQFVKRKFRMAGYQIRALLQKRAGPILDEAISSGTNLSHHPVTMLGGVALMSAFVFLLLIALFSWSGWLAFQSGALVIGAGALHIPFWRFLMKDKPLSFLPGVVAITFLDMLVIASGCLVGTIEYLNGKRL